MSRKPLAAVTAALSVASAVHAQTHVYVDDDAASGGDGLSWDTALNDLQDAIDLAETLGANRGEIRVAGGTYINGDTQPFTIPPGTIETPLFQILGGFAGLEDKGAPDTRDTTLFPSTIYGGGFYGLLHIEENASAPILSAVVLDGLRFQNGFLGMISSDAGRSGIGVLSCAFVGGSNFTNRAVLFRNDVVTVTRCSFENNQSGAIDAQDSSVFVRDSVFRSNNGFRGAAIEAIDSDLDISETLFEENTTSGAGGAIYTFYSTMTVNGCTFRNNESTGADGGAIYTYYTTGSVATIVNESSFEGNRTDDSGGAIYSWNLSEINKCHFANNTAGLNGGACQIGDDSTIQSSDFVANSTVRTGGAVYTSGDRTAIYSSEFNGNAAGWDGGAVRGVESIQSSQFQNNTASDGGAIAFADYVRKCEVRGNTASRGGGGYGIVRLESSILEGNEASQGSALFLSHNNDFIVLDSILRSGGEGTAALIWKGNSPPLDISRSTLVRTGDSTQPMIFVSDGYVWIESSIIWDYVESDVPTYEFGSNSAVVLSHCVTQFGQDDIEIDPGAQILTFGQNIQSDPLFVSLPEGDLSIASASPAIDAGFQDERRALPDRDPYNQSRSPRDDSGIPDSGFGVTRYLDIGAVEFQGTTCLADTNRDGVIAPNDFTAWIAAYNANDPIADQNRDGLIDPGDYTAWINNYSTGCP